jgi:hypothetical protein
MGAVALGCYAIHGSVLVMRGEAEDLLWVCHLGAVLVGAGLLLRFSLINAIGTLFLALGTPLWLMDLAAGGVFLPTSLLTHVAALLIGLWGIRRLGMPRGAWWKAAVGLVGLIALARLLTPAHANVNLAFRIHRGWEEYFPSHEIYLAIIVSEAALYFLALELALRRWLAPAARGSKSA